MVFHTLTDVRVIDPSAGIAIEVGFALLTIAAHCVVLAVVTHTAAHITGGRIDGRVVMATGGMVVAVADWTSTIKTSCLQSRSLTFAGVDLSADGRQPRHVLVEVFALLTIETFGVMRAFAATVNHVWNGFLAGISFTTAGVAIAGTAASDHHIIYGVIILFFDLLSRVKQIVAQIVKFSEIDP